MAGDWLKMRLDLQTHPKVVRILSATGSDKFSVIGGLHAVWGVFDQHSVDGVLQGYTPDLMDHIIGWRGFSAAMIEVGWLEFDGAETLVMPGFETHNGRSGKRRAEDQKRKRDMRRAQPKRPQPVRKISTDTADKREEERREDHHPQSPSECPSRIDNEVWAHRPDWIPADVWIDWCDHRRQIKKRFSPQAAKQLVTKLDGFRREGFDPVSILRESMVNGWQGVFRPKSAPAARVHRPELVPLHERVELAS